MRGEIEDVLQETYLKAFQHLHQFEGRSQFSTWLIRILINQANACLNKNRKYQNTFSDCQNSMEDDIQKHTNTDNYNPEHKIMNQELKKILEDAVDKLPPAYKSVFMMREVEGLDSKETGQGLGLTEENVRIRLHRAKAMLKEELYRKVKGEIEVFTFGSQQCDRLVLSVMAQLGSLN
jgi:RNA polymerase sigma factor (sigma-70 family)